MRRLKERQGALRVLGKLFQGLLTLRRIPLHLRSLPLTKRPVNIYMVRYIKTWSYKFRLLYFAFISCVRHQGRAWGMH